MSRSDSVPSFLSLRTPIGPINTQVSESPMQSEHNIRLANIETELDAVWDSLEGANRNRACLFTLIIFSQEGCRTDYFDQLVDAVIQKFPCRIIHIKSSSAPQKDFLHTNVAAKVIGKGGHEITCDQITVEVSHSLLDRVPFIILPHIIPDLPVYLMWGVDPTLDDKILPHLEQFATRVVFDPECTLDVPRFSRELIQQVGKSGCEVLDLHWARLAGWRQILAQVLGSNENRDFLTNSCEWVIEYNQMPSSAASQDFLQALYLQSWLASRLQWTHPLHQETPDSLKTRYETAGGEVLVHLKSGSRKGVPNGALLSIEIHSRTELHLQIERQGDSRRVRVTRSTPQHCDLPYCLVLSQLSRHHSLMREVFYENVCEHYRRMLESLTQLY